MKQDLRSYALVKAAALLLTVACGVGAIFSWLYCVSRWDTLFEPDSYAYSRAWYQAMDSHFNTLLDILNDFDSLRRGNDLGYLEETQYKERLASLDPSVSNFRYIIRDNLTGKILLSSAGENSLEQVNDRRQFLRTISPDPIYYNYREYDGERDLTLFYDDAGEMFFEVSGNVSQPHAPGETCHYAIEYGVSGILSVQDDFQRAKSSFSRGDIRILYLAAALSAGLVVGTVFLLCCAGRRRGADSFVLNWSDKIPYDLYLFLMGTAVLICFSAGFAALEEGWYHMDDPSLYAIWTLAGTILAAGFALGEAGIMSTATRVKTHTLLRNTILWRMAAGLGRWWKTTFGSWSLTGRVILLFFAYLTGTLLTIPTVVLIPFYQGFVLWCICRWTQQWRALRRGAEAIVGGQPGAVIDTSQMKRFPDLAQHAEQLNDLGGAINTAVEERLKSERMKAELITNVSHDLKTPLTSIINYVDLLKKEEIQGEKAREYIEVLDRKSQRLKKLTEDLVEASKASTGAIAVTPERLGVVQLVNQALGEYSEKLEAARLQPVVTMPEEEVWVNADGRHFWRVLDNLMGNCVKYALPGTRIYLDVRVWDGYVTLSLKNISALQLNIPAEQLMERFVRGDESRTTEGSGLGLSIARSLTELQGGLFRLEVDGDLFKAVVSFPQIK